MDILKTKSEKHFHGVKITKNIVKQIHDFYNIEEILYIDSLTTVQRSIIKELTNCRQLFTEVDLSGNPALIYGDTQVEIDKWLVKVESISGKTSQFVVLDDLAVKAFFDVVYEQPKS